MGDYKVHLKRRHEIVHRGHDVSSDDAAASVAAARAMVEQMEHLLPMEA
jgi:hypothetical protein